MLKHSVYLAVDTPDDMAQVHEAMTLLEGLVEQVPGMHDLCHGPNRDFESKSGAYPYGFIITFADRAAHLEYERHPDHKAAGALLVGACTGGAEGIFVTDLEVAPPR